MPIPAGIGAIAGPALGVVAADALNQSGILGNNVSNFPGISPQAAQGILEQQATINTRNSANALASQFDRLGTPASTNTAFTTDVAGLMQASLNQADLGALQLSEQEMAQLQSAQDAVAAAQGGTPTGGGLPNSNAGGNNQASPPSQGPSNFPGGPNVNTPGGDGGGNQTGGAASDPNQTFSI